MRKLLHKLRRTCILKSEAIMDFAVKFVISEGDNGFFGPGVRDLFLNIDSENSVKAACEKMDLSYSKAWKMIRNVEKAMGQPAVERTHGGADGGSAKLTAAGKKLLQCYLDFEKKGNEALCGVFRDSFSDLI